MLGLSWHRTLSRVIRTLQIVVGLLIAGCVISLGGAVVVVQRTEPPARLENLPLLTCATVGFAVAASIARWVVTFLGHRRCPAEDYPGHLAANCHPGHPISVRQAMGGKQ